MEGKGVRIGLAAVLLVAFSTRATEEFGAVMLSGIAAILAGFAIAAGSGTTQVATAQ